MDSMGKKMDCPVQVPWLIYSLAHIAVATNVSSQINDCPRSFRGFAFARKQYLLEDVSSVLELEFPLGLTQWRFS